MRLIAVLLMISAMGIAFAQQSYSEYGGTRYYQNGVTSQQSGNQTYYSNGVSAQQIGNQTYYSNGKSCQHIGNQTYCN